MIKKYIFLFCTAFFIAGCSQTKDEYQSFVSRSFIGQIQEAQIPIEDLNDIYALTTDANSVVYLQSFVHDLAAFEDKRVKVTGDFKVLDLAHNSVDFLMVNTIDSLEAVQIAVPENELKIYNFANLGIKFPAVTKLEIKESQDSIFFTLESTNFLITKKSLDGYEYSSYLLAYSDIASDLLRIGDYDFNVFFNSDYEQLYTLQVADSVLEVKVSLFESSKQSTIDSFLSNLVIVNEPENRITEVNTSLEDVQQDEQDNAVQLQNLTSGGPIDSSVEPSNGYIDEQLESELKPSIPLAQLSAGANSEYTSKLVIGNKPYVSDTNIGLELNSPYSDLISRFTAGAKDLLPSYTATLEYAFAESNYFYVIYLDIDSNRQRALVAYTPNDFKIVAEFAADSVMDWRLTSGQNPVYDESLTVFSIDLETNDFNVHNLKEGFRLFESLPLEFSLHYPKDWFYKREADAYVFSNSADMTSVLLSVELINSFDMQAFARISNDLFFNAGVYVRVVSNGKYLKITSNNVDISTIEYIVNSTREL